MVQHVGLIVGEGANRILPEVRVVKGQHFEVGKSIEVQDLFERADFVSAEIQVTQLCQRV